jgi:hypothetical protein
LPVMHPGFGDLCRIGGGLRKAGGHGLFDAGEWWE